MKLRHLATALLLVFTWTLPAAIFGGPNSDAATVASSGSSSAPSPGASQAQLGDPKMGGVNFGFVAVPEPTTCIIFGGIGLLGYVVWRQGRRRGWARHALLRRLE
jgi:hypothetical protein